jgi:RNA polymerase sigma-70 factor (ECF subfamily)
MNDPAHDEQDRQDMARLAAGQNDALNDLMERHSRRLFHYLLRQLSDPSDAEDCAQEAFVRVYLHRAKFRSTAKFSTWLYAIATNLARDCHRRSARHPEVSPPESRDGRPGGMEMMPDHSPGPGDELQAGEQAAQVRAAVQALPEELREPLVLFEYENLAQSEIALILRCTPKAVETRIYRARNLLRETLAGLCPGAQDTPQ